MANSRFTLVASGTFFVAYLAAQVIYPMLPWILPGHERFTWEMYAGRHERPQFAAVFADGSRREAGNPLSRDNMVRLLGSQVDQRRFVPPYLCTAWPGAQAVEVRYRRPERVEVIPCHAR